MDTWDCNTLVNRYSCRAYYRGCAADPSQAGRQSSRYEFETSALPFKAVFLLNIRDADLAEPSIEPLPPAESILALVGNTYVDYIIDAEQRKAELVRFSRLLSSVKVYGIQRPDDLDQLETMCDLIAGTVKGT